MHMQSLLEHLRGWLPAERSLDGASLFTLRVEFPGPLGYYALRSSAHSFVFLDAPPGLEVPGRR